MRRMAAVVAFGATVLAGVPECHYDMYQCINSYNPQFSDLLQRRFDGDSGIIAGVNDNRDTYCTMDNWVKRSEVCGPCAYTFEFTSGVPAEYIGLQHCVGALEKTPYIEESNLDIASPYNGREMRVVTHTQGGGCSTADYGDADLTDTIAFYNYMDSFGCGGGIAGGARVQRKLGNKLSFLMFTFHNALSDNQPWRLRSSSRDIEDVVMMQAKSEAQDLPILKLLHSATGEVRGKIVYHCGAGKPRGNVKEADLSQYGGGDCPWWFIFGKLCEGHRDPAKRLCSGCPLMMHDPVTKDALACLHNPELVPMRRYHNMADMLDFPLQEKVLFIDHSLLPNKDYLCDFDKWNLDLVRGRIVAFHPPPSSWRCSRPDYAILMQKAGVRAWVVLDSRRVHGVAVAQPLSLPIGSMSHEMENLLHTVYDYFRQGTKVANYTVEMEVLFQKPAPVVWNDTPAPEPTRAELPPVDTDTKALMAEPVAVVGVLVIPIAVLAVVAKVVHGSITAIPLPASRGVPLGLSSTLLSASLAVTLAVVTFVLAESAGKEAEKAQRENKDDAVQVMVSREVSITNDLTTVYLKSTTAAADSAYIGAYKRMWADVGAVRGLATFDPNEAETWANWETRIRFLNKQTNFRERRRSTTGSVTQLFLFNGWMISSDGAGYTSNDPDAYMLNGSQATLRDTNQPLLYPLLFSQGGTRHPFEKSVYDPFKRLWWTDIPQQFNSVLDMARHPDHLPLTHQMKLYLGEYQVNPAVSFDSQGKLTAPYFTGTFALLPLGLGKDFVGICTVSFPADELASKLQEAIRGNHIRNKLAENMTYVMHTEDGLIYTSDTDAEDAWRTVDHYGNALIGTQRGFHLFTLFDALDWRFNAYANYVLSKYGRLDAKSADGQVIVDTFCARDYYRGYRTEWMWFPFDGAVGEVGWHVWDTWMECQGGGSGCFRFDTGHDGRGQALYLDGTGAVRVSPYLTQRVPRVARRRVGGVAGYQSMLDYYNNTLPWGGVPDVIVTQRNLRPSVEGEQWRPVEREKVFYRSDYSVSVWVRRERASGGKKGLIFADSVTPDTNLRLYEDGSVVISIISYGCRTAAVPDLPVGEWVFMTATVRFARRREMGYCAMYVDGVRRTKSPMGDRVPMTAVASNYSIGHGFQGHIDDLRVHNQTLSGEQVQQLMQTGDARWIPDQELTFALQAEFQTDPDRVSSHKEYIIAVMLPQEDIVRESKENSAKMSAVVAAQDKVTQDNLDRRNTATWLMVVAIILVGVFIFVAYNAMLARPFAQFALDISFVSQIDLDNVQAYSGGSSMLQEVNVMRAAMNVLVANMKTFKSFMPLAMQEAVAAVESDSEMSAGSFSLSTSRRSSHRFGTDSQVSTSRSESNSTSVAGAFKSASKALAVSLCQKKMGFLLVNLVDFHNETVKGNAAATLDRHRDYIAIIVELSVPHKGLPDTFSGDRIVVTFNGAKTNTYFREHPPKVGLLVVAALKKKGLSASSAAVAGSVLAGHIGVDSMMRYSTIGRCVSWLYHLERYARQHNVSVLTDKSIFEPCATIFLFNHCAVIDTKQAPYNAPAVLTHVVRESAVAADEWMYELEKAHDNLHANWNEILLLVSQRLWDAAKDALQKVPVEGTPASSYEDIRKSVMTCSIPTGCVVCTCGLVANSKAVV